MRVYNYTITGIQKFHDDNERLFDEIKVAESGDDVDTYFDKVAALRDKFKQEVLGVATNPDILLDHIIAQLANGIKAENIKDVWSLADIKYDKVEEKPKKVIVYNLSDAKKVWSKTPAAAAVVDNLVVALSEIDAVTFDDAIKKIRRNNSAEMSIGPVTIVVPSTYYANMPEVLKLEKRRLSGKVEFLEMKFDIKGSDAHYRIYGFIILNTTTVYLFKAYTKNNGQEDASKFFDYKFMTPAIQYIQNNIKLTDSLLYSIKNKNVGGIKLMETMDVFDELNDILDEQTCTDVLRGMNDANDGKLIEDCASSDYIRGYNAIKEALNAVAEKNKGVYQPGLDFIERHGGLDALMEELEKREKSKKSK